MKPYLRFIRSVDAFENEFLRVNCIDRRGLKLLEVIAVKHEARKSLMTTEVMALSQYGSPSVIHHSLLMLRDAKLALVFHKGQDRRAKYLCVSDKAYEYYRQLGLALIASIDAMSVD
jgi:hypothetical protein